MGNLSKKVGRRIKQLRESLKIKQFELAEEQNKEELIQKINSLLEQCDKPELEYIYNSIRQLRIITG